MPAQELPLGEPCQSSLGFWTQRLLAHNHLFPAGWEVCTASDPGQGEHSQVLWLQFKGLTSLSLNEGGLQSWAGDPKGE